MNSEGVLGYLLDEMLFFMVLWFAIGALSTFLNVRHMIAATSRWPDHLARAEGIRLIVCMAMAQASLGPLGVLIGLMTMVKARQQAKWWIERDNKQA